MLREFFFRGSWHRIAAAWLGLFVFVGHQVFKVYYLKLGLNSWYENFYDILQSHAEEASGEAADSERARLRGAVEEQLWAFAALVAPAVAVHPLAGLVRNGWVFLWRRTLIKSYLAAWDVHAMPVEGASQRTHEDSSRFASGVQNCVSSLLDSLFTLVAFCPVLYSLDPRLFLVAGATAVGGVGVSWLVGWPLVGLEINNQQVEACLRRDLVLLEATPEIYTHSPLVSFRAVLARLTANYKRLYLAFAGLQTWLSGFEQAAVVLPYVLVGPRLFAADPADRLTLGQLVATTNAFDKVFSSLNVVSDNWLAINEFRSVLRRLREFERAVGSSRPVRAQLVPPGFELSDGGAAENDSAVDSNANDKAEGSDPPSPVFARGASV